jgi:hypothetical protein
MFFRQQGRPCPLRASRSRGTAAAPRSTADGATPQAVQLQALIDRAFATHGFVPYGEVYGYVHGIDDPNGALLTAGEPTQ